MNYKPQTKTGFTLTEIVVVLATMSLLVAFGLPVMRMIRESFESKTGGKSMISAALSSARAIAAKEQHYAGIRFQRDSDGNQYMIFIIHDFEKTGLNPGFRAVQNLKPTKLPENLGVMDTRVRINHGTNWKDAEDPLDEPLNNVAYLDDTNPQNLGPDQKNRYITDTSSFSIVFSPSGKLIMRDVRIRNRDGIYQPDNDLANKRTMDSVFNSPQNITNGVGKFIQDDYAELGLGVESSRNGFVIYDKIRFDKLNAIERFNYLSNLEPVHINPYTGTIISTD
ncbi:MAG: pilus assembly FimT family protein [Planctomycetota bacterium]|jgi:type II secretory pathway pseudopilin PulG